MKWWGCEAQPQTPEGFKDTSRQSTEDKKQAFTSGLQPAKTDWDRSRRAHEPGTQELGSWWLTICCLCHTELAQGAVRRAADGIWYIWNCARKSCVTICSSGRQRWLKMSFWPLWKRRCSAIICNFKNNNNCQLDKIVYDIKISNDAFVILQNASAFCSLAFWFLELQHCLDRGLLPWEKKSLLRWYQNSKVFEITGFSNAEGSDFCDTPSFPPTEHSSAIHYRAVRLISLISTWNRDEGAIHAVGKGGQRNPW